MRPLALLLLAAVVSANPTPELTAKRSRAEIERTLKAIEATGRAPTTTARKPDKEEATAVPRPSPSELAKARTETARLNAYRYLAGLSYDVKLDEELSWTCKFGAEICRRLGTIDHRPPKPAGMDDAAYRRGFEATTNSNLYWSGGKDGLTGSVDGYMDDSDPSNVARVGHRRWCLNPPMAKTGFGVAGGASAMWAFDRSGRDSATAIVCFPAAGHYPLDYLRANAAWSISLAPERYQLTEIHVGVVPLPATAGRRFPDDLKGLKEIPLSDVRIDRSNIGIEQCVIFRPQVSIRRGDRFGVILEGVQGLPGKRLAYTVEFF